MYALFQSYRLDYLIDQFIYMLESYRSDPMESQTILVPNQQIGNWLLIEVAKRKKIAMGLKVLEPTSYFQTSPNQTLLFTSIYTYLNTSTDKELLQFIEGKEKRKIFLAEELSKLILKYGLYEHSLVEGKVPGFQGELLKTLGQIHPVQQQKEIQEPLILFAIDYLPPIFWKFLTTCPALSIFLFSPCQYYWGDIASDRERTGLVRQLEKKGVSEGIQKELDSYLRQAPEHLRNWGKLGKRTLKTLDEIEAISNENYPPIEPSTLLKQIQCDLLNYEKTKQPRVDNSIELFLTGTSKLDEIRICKEEIIKLGIPYEDISVLAPDIGPYVPLIEYVFSNEIPFRISGFDVGANSSYRQAFFRLMALHSKRWSLSAFLTLIETPAFYKKMGWDLETLETFRTWFEFAKITWGADSQYRKTVLKGTLGQKSFEDFGSWELGLDRLLETFIYRTEFRLNPDLFEQLIVVYEGLMGLELQKQRTLKQWAEVLELITGKFLYLEERHETDSLAQHQIFRLIEAFRESENETLFPIHVIEHLARQPIYGQINGAHLHAVRFSNLGDVAQIPAKVVFLIGMDETNFPRTSRHTSLDLLSHRSEIPSVADHDRYLFLEALFSCKNFLRISYNHLSEEEGKPIAPSLVVQELLNLTGEKIKKTRSLPKKQPLSKHLIWPRFQKAVETKQSIQINISELRRLLKNPWNFYLLSNEGIYLDQSLEPNFALQKSVMLRAMFEGKEEKPPLPGMLGQALEIEVEERFENWQKSLQEWQISQTSIELKVSCKKVGLENEIFVSPPITLNVDGIEVEIIGSVPKTSKQGMISLQQDTIAGAIRVWADALVTAIVFDVPQVYFLKSGKKRNFIDPTEGLVSLVRYYLHAKNAPSPLINEWVDAFLRKDSSELEKIRSKKSTQPDPVVEWVFARAQLPTSQELFADWESFLKENFSQLISMYPTRGKR